MMEKLVTNREYGIDMMKGISILMIIMIHCLCKAPINLRAHFPFLCLLSDSFALPMFFLIAGFLYHHDTTPFYCFFIKKAKRLLYPYLFFGSVAVLLRFTFSTITYNPDNSNLCIGIWKIFSGQIYWFLYSMFIVLIVNRFLFKY